MKFFQASEIRFSNSCSCFFPLLLQYTELISLTNGLRNVHRIPNNASPIPLTIAFKLLLFTKWASHLLLSDLYYAADLHLSLDKWNTHPSFYFLYVYTYIHSLPIYSRNSSTTCILVVGSHIIPIKSFCRLKLINFIMEDTSVLWINNNT